MPTRSQVCAWVAACSVVPSLALAQDRSDREVVELIVREGPQAAVINAGVEAVRRDQMARLSYPNPAVSYIREGAGFTEFLQVEQALPIFGVRGAVDRAGTAATEAADADRAARLWALRADAAVLVSSDAAGAARVDIVNEYVRQVQRLIAILRTREREGEGSRFDRVRAEHELRDVQLTATTVGIEVSDLRMSVAAMLPGNTPVGRITWSPTPRPVPPLETLVARAMASRADLRALDRSSVRADLESAAASRAKFASPVVLAGVKRADGASGRETGGVFGLTFSVPLFDSGSRDSARWTAERERLTANRSALEQQIRTEIVRASEALTRRQAALAEAIEGAGDELMTMAEVAYREGEIGILELLDAVRTTARARSRQIDLQLDLRLAEIALERAVGDVLWP